MSSKYQIYIFSLFLILLSLGLITYKVKYLNFPLTASERSLAWNVEAKITFSPIKSDNSTIISLALPQEQRDLDINSGISSSTDYVFTESSDEGTKRGEWTKKSITDEQTLYYKVNLLEKAGTTAYPGMHDEPVNDPYVKISLPAKVYEMPSLISFLKRIRAESADSISFASLMIDEFSKAEPKQDVNLILKALGKSVYSLRDLYINLLTKENYHGRRVGTITLEDGLKNRRLKSYLEVYGRGRWYLFDLEKGRIRKPANMFIWYRGGHALLEAQGAKNSRVRFSVKKSVISARKAAIDTNDPKKTMMLDFSLFVLPTESQNAFKRLLIVPFGALVVVFMRVFIGLKTSGTFMPILLAMAFLQTKLIPGIILFLVIVGIGLIVRSYLSYLNLLLVARISAGIVIVIGIMASVAILTHKMNVLADTGITFFPMIILAWTIERMSVLWEEEGPKNVFEQGGGSILVAILTYFLLSSKTLGFITFNFPEVLLAVLGIIIVMGRYNGYRLSELYRFASLSETALDPTKTQAKETTTVTKETTATASNKNVTKPAKKAKKAKKAKEQEEAEEIEKDVKKGKTKKKSTKSKKKEK